MMSGDGTGKGLNIKGKSAKSGRLSGLSTFRIALHKLERLRAGASDQRESP